MRALDGFSNPAPADVWDLNALHDVRADPADRACAITGRGLTEDEWAGYLSTVRYQRTCTR